MNINCPQLKPDNFLPKKYTCDGKDISPPLTISDVPDEAKSLVLIMDDPDAPGGVFTHWLVWNIHPVIKEIEENQVPLDAVEGCNSTGSSGYKGACPPSGTHRYRFKLYALNKYLSVSKNIDQSELETELEKHLLKKAVLITKYSR